ncbi:hypothetical protein NDU88_005773 [Pleurodeles waltl]|uniref:Uncharacterized protein n=1 Tax=Pleurodeles waltl TaxID=8319 RepID=A0AAV7L3I9_PLEWA|nr:hypothetical protein NDU88_005773 [Pleurodeles waltl]
MTAGSRNLHREPQTAEISPHTVAALLGVFTAVPAYSKSPLLALEKSSSRWVARKIHIRSLERKLRHSCRQARKCVIVGRRSTALVLSARGSRLVARSSAALGPKPEPPRGLSRGLTDCTPVSVSPARTCGAGCKGVGGAWALKTWARDALHGLCRGGVRRPAAGVGARAASGASVRACGSFREPTGRHLGGRTGVALPPFHPGGRCGSAAATAEARGAWRGDLRRLPPAERWHRGSYDNGRQTSVS